MREIEFRAWLKKDKKMVEVKSIHFGTKKIMYGYSESSHCYGNVTCKFDDCELMQYTGLTDKNGTKIFEGDIVKDYYGRIMKVVFMECLAKYQLILVEATGESWTNNFIRADLTDWFAGVCLDALPEIIGNIYDNPELLGGAK